MTNVSDRCGGGETGRPLVAGTWSRGQGRVSGFHNLLPKVVPRTRRAPFTFVANHC